VFYIRLIKPALPFWIFIFLGWPKSGHRRLACAKFRRKAPLTPTLSPQRGEREYYRSSFLVPSPPMGERVRVRGN
jgi:hypothetical protein